LVTRDQIRERLKFKDVDIGTSDTAVFSAVVGDGIKRNIVAIVLICDATKRTVEIKKLEHDGTTYTMMFDDYNVAADSNGWIPPEYDPERTIIMLVAGENLYLKASSAIAGTVIYWDDEEKL